MEISIEELIKLKELGKNPRQISKYFKENGIDISVIEVTKRLSEYYEKIGFFDKKASKIKKESVINLQSEKLVKTNETEERKDKKTNNLTEKPLELKEKKIKDSKSEDKKITTIQTKKTVIKKEKIQDECSSQFEFKTQELKISNNMLKKILMSGLSIKDYCEKNEVDSRYIIKSLQMLKVLVEHSCKIGDKWIRDEEFMAVIRLLENEKYMYPYQRYSRGLQLYTSKINRIEPWCDKGNIDLMRYRVFDGNADLMTFVLNGCNIKYGEYDIQVRKKKKQSFEEKLERYFTRLNLLVEKDTDKRHNSKKANNKKVINENNEEKER